MVPKLDNEVPPSVNTSTPALVNLTWVSNGFILAPNDEEAFASAVLAAVTPMAPETDDDAAAADLASATPLSILLCKEPVAVLRDVS